MCVRVRAVGVCVLCVVIKLQQCRTQVLLGAERFMASWHKSEEEASKLREVNRAA